LFELAPDGTATVKIPMEVADSALRTKVTSLAEALEEHEDVEQVVHNMV
jgi:transcriptional/translational regulatory protein YebC/TACO1